VETPHVFIIAKLSDRKPGSSQVPIEIESFGITKICGLSTNYKLQFKFVRYFFN
jgi:hypothetical protein